MTRMNIVWKHIALAAAMAVMCAGCSDPGMDTPDDDPDMPETPVDPDGPDGPLVREKPVVLWVDAEANFSRLRTKTGINNLVRKAKESGFNGIVVDVKPCMGKVLYDSDFLPKCTNLGGTYIPNRGFDYLEYFIERARAYNMRVTVSATIMTMGGTSRNGLLYEDEEWARLACIEWLPEGLVPITEADDLYTIPTVNPILPEVHDYVIRMVSEIVTKYDFDGFCLDYCRYMNINSDFSDASREAFEEYAGVIVENWPQDIFTFNSSSRSDYTPGIYYNKWVEWRAAVIQNYVKDIRDAIKTIKPDVDLEYWAASWWPLPHTGQNWASPARNMASSYWWATPDYYKTGFADQLDIFQLGSYLSRIYEDGTQESIQYALSRCNTLLNGECNWYGTFSVDQKTFDSEEATYLCLTQSPGCMVFEAGHVYNTDCWDKIKAGIDRAWEELGVNAPLMDEE